MTLKILRAELQNWTPRARIKRFAKQPSFLVLQGRSPSMVSISERLLVAHSLVIGALPLPLTLLASPS